MHTLFLLAALLAAASVSGLGALLLRATPPGERQSPALVVLAAPVFVLGLAASHAIPGVWTACAPLIGWDRAGTVALLSAQGGSAVAALALNLSRLVLVERLLRACRAPDAAVLDRLAAVARRARQPAPALRVLETGGALAVTGGVMRPTIVVSTWLLERLDQRELEAVMAHELAHIARRDHLVRWLGELLRDATVYLPGGWYALRVLRRDQELASDAAAVGITRRPLAMASSLVKIWRTSGARDGAPLLSSLPSHGGSADLFEERLSRLLAPEPPRCSRWRGRLLAGAAALSVGGLTPRVLATAATATPLVCSLRPGMMF